MLTTSDEPRSAARRKNKGSKKKRDMPMVKNGEDRENDNQNGKNDDSPEKHGLVKLPDVLDTSTTDSDSSSRTPSLPPEYQFSSDLFNALSLLVSSSPATRITFRGRYSIVSSPEVDHLTRIILVSQDLKLKANLKFRSGAFISYYTNRDQVPQLRSMRFSCLCSIPPNSNSNSSSAAQHPTESSEPTPCDGVVTVKSEDDFSHWLGIKGHRITVLVEHAEKQLDETPIDRALD